MYRFKFSIILLIISSTSFVHAQPQLEVAFPNLSFTRPVDLQHAGDESNRIFVVEQAGIISVFENDKDVPSMEIFMDIRNQVSDSGNEEGLLGLAFHPNYTNNGFFYVYYSASNPRRSVISQFHVDSNDSNRADLSSELILMEVGQPFSNHNGGQIAFGPDGFFYISLGDGGSGNDPLDHGQDRRTLLGTILRIDVDNPSGGQNYGIPSDNPFVGNNQGFHEEIYAYGLRNVWRFSFDFKTGWLWAADVGQSAREEINIIENGKNYGWKIMEGFICRPQTSGCNMSGLENPIWDFPRDQGRSVTGGFVYRGSGVPELLGRYIYGDFVTGRIWALNYDGANPAENTELMHTNLSISSFGIDENNELYICAFDGKIYRFKPTVTSEDSNSEIPSQFILSQNYPNPFVLNLHESTTIHFSLAQRGDVSIHIYNLHGELVRRFVPGILSAGEFRFQWNGKDKFGERLASGIYFFRLVVDGSTKLTNRMTILK